MTSHKEILAIIPARGGSKGVCRKNIRPVGGKPLIAYSIETALASRRITRTIVSTDDGEIAATARGHGAETPFLRPPELAQDRSSLDLVVAQAATFLEKQGYRPDAICVLLPTHPFRTRRLVDVLLGRMDEGIRSVSTVIPVAWEDLRLPDGRPVPIKFTRSIPDACRPALSMVRPYGVFGVTSRLLTQGVYHHVIQNPVSRIDIDYPYDLALADAILRRKLFDFEEGYQGCWD